MNKVGKKLIKAAKEAVDWWRAKMNEVSIYQRAKQILAEYKTIDQVKDYRDQAMAIRIYAQQAQDRELEENAIDARMRAERRLGELLEVTEKKKAGNPTGSNQYQSKNGIGFPKNPIPSIADQGIDKNLAHRARTYARMPEEEFEEHVKKKVKAPRVKTRKGTTAYGLVLKDLMGIKRQLPKLLKEVANEPDKKERTCDLLQEIQDVVRDLLKELNSTTGEVLKWSGR